MHRFNRGTSPVDFKKVSGKYKTWEAFVRDQKAGHFAIRDALYERQRHYCAYCETEIKIQNGKSDSERLAGHIEHLERRADVPSKTFEWNNMFLSCNRPDSCGNYKDGERRRFNVDDIIDPSKENPLNFFKFDELGKVTPIAAATSEIKRKVEETVRVFNLNGSSRLLEIRLRAIEITSAFLETTPTEEEIEEFLNALSERTPCISVYYATLEARLAYEERFTSTS